jgi:hypothetical protein
LLLSDDEVILPSHLTRALLLSQSTTSTRGLLGDLRAVAELEDVWGDDVTFLREGLCAWADESFLCCDDVVFEAGVEDGAVLGSVAEDDDDDDDGGSVFFFEAGVDEDDEAVGDADSFFFFFGSVEATLSFKDEDGGRDVLAEESFFFCDEDCESCFNTFSFFIFFSSSSSSSSSSSLESLIT